MHIKAKTLHFIYAKKLKIVQIQEKSLWCILKYVLCKAKQVLCTDAAEGAENCAQYEIEAKVIDL